MADPVRVAALPGCGVSGALAVADEAAARRAGCTLLLCRVDGALSLRNLDSDWLPLSLTFDAGALGWRLAHERVRHERLVKALGGMPTSGATVLDATAGLGRDALVMARAGYRVQMVERSPVLAALLRDALARLGVQQPELAARLSLVEGDALALLDAGDSAAVVYLDPMFPGRSKAAAVKKDLQLLQLLLAHEPESDELALLDAARARARKRVVVKRPAKAPALAGQAPNHSVAGKAVRFDVYLP
ncbi:MAG: class I SAM-dependent methyltransferase [Alcanivoracaceae bacterium]|nr:class I SAM-dependent methyltransferase [Alcanivoracaceae bacterium]